MRDRTSRAVAAVLLVVVLAAAAFALTSSDTSRDSAVADAPVGGSVLPVLSVPDLWVARETLRRSEAASGDMRIVPTRQSPGVRPGRYALRARYKGGGRNGYSRIVLRVDWRRGQEVRYGATFLLPEGFVESMQGEVDLLRFDNYPLDPAHNDRGGVVIYHEDRRARLVRQRFGRAQVIIGEPFALPTQRWFKLEVRQRLLPRSTVNEVYVDGQLVLKSARGNSYGRPIRRLRAGLVAVARGAQRQPLKLYVDAPWARVTGRR